MQADSSEETDPTAPLTEQASGWWVLLNEGDVTDADRRAFAEWAARSPDNVSAYLRATQVAQALRGPGMPWPDTPVDELIRSATADRAPLAAAMPDTRASRRTARLAPRFAFAALCAMVVAAAGLYIFEIYARPQRFETALGEQRSVMLRDGSLVTLNTSSAIDVRFDGTERRITLRAGEALFQVEHDVARPFDVTAGEVTVRAVGTRFSVDRHLQDMRVVVVEGRVEVSAGAAHVALHAGEQLTLAPSGAPQVSETDVAAATAWTRRQLVFENRPLGEVAAELNRYNRRVIDIRSAQLRDERVTGVFQSNDPASFLAFVARIPGVSVETSDQSRYVVRQSGQP